MKKDQVVILEKRGVILISGDDAKDFLQNIITNDINKVSDKNSIFAALLTPQGKYLNDFFKINEPEIFVIGEPKQKDNSNSQIESLIKKFSMDFRKRFPSVKVHRHDERFTSKIAKRFLINSGAKRKIRHNKSIIDKISATIILQDFLDKYKKI